MTFRRSSHTTEERAIVGESLAGLFVAEPALSLAEAIRPMLPPIGRARVM